MCRFHALACTPYAEFFSLHSEEVVERKNPPVPKLMHGELYEFMIPGIHFTYIKYKGTEKSELLFRAAQPFISMVFVLKTHLVYTNERETVFAELNHNEQQLVYLSNQQTHLQWEAERGAELFIINLTIDYFKRFFNKSHPLYSVFESSVFEKTPAAFIDQTLNISPRMLKLLYDITQCDLKKEYKKLFVKSKVLELMMLQFELSENAFNAEDAALLKNVNVEKMHLARDIITSNLSQPCSIVDLAQQIGTNDCYLKKHFKQVFGTTVYGYLHKERMERSRELLLDGSKKISEVARLAGYKHASHFTSAFKKYFGYLPNKIRLVVFSVLTDPEWIVLLDTPVNVLVA